MKISITNLLLHLVLLTPLCSSDSSINPNDFCKLSVEKDCSIRNAPHIFQCGQGMCARNQTECNEFLREKKATKTYRVPLFINAMNFLVDYSQKRLKDNIMRFESSIKSCSQTAYEWQPSQACLRGRHCFQYQIEYVKSKLVFYIQRKRVLRQVDCPCPKYSSYVCGRNYCSLNKETCENTYSMKNKSELFGIKKCVNNFILID